MNPFTLTPGQPYTLSYYITDHTDPTSYFVQAIIYDAATGAIIDTENLVQQTTNSHWYSKVAQAPADRSGHGRRILVVATAYQDSAYTVKSPLYQQQPENYIVAAPGAGLSLGGGGGSFDYQAIHDMLTLHSSSILKEIGLIAPLIETLRLMIAIIPTKITDIQPILTLLDEISVTPPAEKPDLAPLHTAIDAVLAAVGQISGLIGGIEMPQPTDITPLHEAIAGLESKLPIDKPERHLELMEAVSSLHGGIRVIAGYPKDSDAKVEKKPADGLRRGVRISTLI